MSLKRIKSNLGFLIAGAILFGVAVNVYMEFNNTNERKPECRSSLTR